ncbi:MAG: hypothetical protein COW03_09405 [Cytophagales bacterium CG12_big_fil_rev_8_21_14_0_65_40_12]|nr:MAG: hypothetical protein COW03_09405 [Cytophagales bacterium CG12_big_fil_rev_8_21_14_0_65_40_12]PIW05531.1 MAG: hypothetical protein COW40_03525 [Cytophagales bacterium CG17_big_fil_post_rev_8_21_14_2_50_40_13]
MSLRILYLSTSYIPYRRADSVHVMKMCNALAFNGFDVTLVAKKSSKYRELSTRNDYEFYGVENGFKIRKVWRPTFKGGDLIFTILCLSYTFLRFFKTDIIYSRSNSLALLTAFLNIPLVYEIHGLPNDSRGQRIHKRIMGLKNLRTIVVISEALKQDILVLNPEILNKVIVAHDGADIIDHPHSGESLIKIQVGYIGHLYSGRGIELILECAKNLPDFDFNIIGGEEVHIDYFKKRYQIPNVIFHGFVSPGELNLLYGKQDILLMPYQKQVGIASGTLDTSKWMSPMKMFEYMASGKAIISSEISVLKEVLTHEHNAILLPPDQIDKWIDEIKILALDSKKREFLGRNALNDLKMSYTWNSRAKKVMSFRS